MKFSTRLLLLLLVLVAVPAQAQRHLYVPRSTANAVSVYDTQTNAFVGAVTVGSSPWSVAVHPTGQRAYVANVDSNSVSVIDTASSSVVATIPVGLYPYHLALTPDGSELWVANYGAGTVSVVDTGTHAVVATVSGVPYANAIAFSPDGSRVFVTNYATGGIHEIDVASRVQRRILPLGSGSEGLAVSADGRRLLATDVDGNHVSVYDLASGTRTQVDIEAQSWGVAADPAGRYWYIAGGNRTVFVLRQSDNAVLSTIDLASGTGAFLSPTGLSLDPSGTFAYVVNRNLSSVSVVNLVTRSVVDLDTTSGAPYGLGVGIARPLWGHGTLAAGQYHSCRVRGDYSVDCWGRNGDGQADAPAGRFVDVAGGSAHTCGLRVDGSLACWGNNVYGQLAAPTGSFTALASGPRHACALRTDGRVLCWGENDQGQATAPSGTDFVAVSAGTSHSCALRSSGNPNVTCWGNGGYGQTTVPTGSYLQVVAAGGYTCGLRSNRTVACWGLADGGRTAAPSGAFARLFAQTAYVCGIRPDGSTACWGVDGSGETDLGTGALAHVATGRAHSCSLAALGDARCSGSNVYGQAPRFVLEGAPPAALTRGQAMQPVRFAMTVANPGTSGAGYTPRPTAYALAGGSLPPGLTLGVDGELAGTPATLGSFHFRIEAQDSNGFSAAGSFSIVVGGSDATPPVLVPVVTGTAGIDGWYRSDVHVAWSATDPDSEATLGAGCASRVFSAETASTMVTCVATSAGGSTTVSYEVKIDRTAPVMSPVVSNRRPLQHEVISVAVNGADALSGVASEVCDPPSTAVVVQGQTRINCTVTDRAGNAFTRAVSYNVLHGFSGFTGDVANPGWWNAASTATPVTFRYRLTDAEGRPVLGAPPVTATVEALACPASVRQTVPAATAAPGHVELGDGWYEFTWVTPAAPGCARVVLDTGDGDHMKRAQFRFE